MWSRSFIAVGVLSSLAIAALALAGMWLAIPFMRLAIPPTWMAAGATGLVVYPLCWYRIICRARDYSPVATWRLIVGTYAVCCLIVIVIGAGVAAYVLGQAPALPNRGYWEQILWSIIAAPLLAALYLGTLAMLLAIPFVAVAAPLAFLHRALLLAVFSRRLRPDGL